MNEVVQVGMAGWAEMIKQRSESRMAIVDRCAEHQISKNTYDYRLRQLREYARKAVEDSKGETTSAGGFAWLPSARNEGKLQISVHPEAFTVQGQQNPWRICQMWRMRKNFRPCGSQKMCGRTERMRDG